MKDFMWWKNKKNKNKVYKTGAEREDETKKLRVDLIPYDLIVLCKNKANAENIDMEELSQQNQYQWVLDWQTSKDDPATLARLLCLFVTYHLVVPRSLESLAYVMTDGLKKYPKDNWKKGIPIDRCINSLTRHYLSFCVDESNMEHLGGMLFNALAIVYYIENDLYDN